MSAPLSSWCFGNLATNRPVKEIDEGFHRRNHPGNFLQQAFARLYLRPQCELAGDKAF